MSAMGNYRGGAAKIAVFGSALFGMISGAAVEHVVAVGVVPFYRRCRAGSHRRARRHRGGRLDRRTTDAAGDGCRRLHHGEFLQVPYGAADCRAIPALLYYACAVHSCRSGSRQGQDRRRQVENAPKSATWLNPAGTSLVPIVFLVLPASD